MAQLHINVLRNVRLKNVVLGGLVLMSLALSFSFVGSDIRATGIINKSEATNDIV